MYRHSQEEIPMISVLDTYYGLNILFVIARRFACYDAKSKLSF